MAYLKPKSDSVVNVCNQNYTFNVLLHFLKIVFLNAYNHLWAPQSHDIKYSYLLEMLSTQHYKVKDQG